MNTVYILFDLLTILFYNLMIYVIFGKNIQVQWSSHN